jgi:hypothetical protein
VVRLWASDDWLKRSIGNAIRGGLDSFGAEAVKFGRFDVASKQWTMTKIAPMKTTIITLGLLTGLFLPVRYSALLPASGEAGPIFIEDNPRLRQALEGKGYNIRYVEVSGARHDPIHWRFQLADSILCLAGTQAVPSGDKGDAVPARTSSD